MGSPSVLMHTHTYTHYLLLAFTRSCVLHEALEKIRAFRHEFSLRASLPEWPFSSFSGRNRQVMKARSSAWTGVT